MKLWIKSYGLSSDALTRAADAVLKAQHAPVFSA